MGIHRLPYGRLAECCAGQHAHAILSGRYDLTCQYLADTPAVNAITQALYESYNLSLHPGLQGWLRVGDFPTAIKALEAWVRTQLGMCSLGTDTLIMNALADSLDEALKTAAVMGGDHE